MGLQHQAAELAAKMTEIQARIAAGESTLSVESSQPKKRVLSPAGRRKIAEAQRQRWEAYRKAADSGATAVQLSLARPRDKKNRLSPAASQRISEANKKRWDAFRAAKAAAAQTTAQDSAPSSTEMAQPHRATS